MTSDQLYHKPMAYGLLGKALSYMDFCTVNLSSIENQELEEIAELGFYGKGKKKWPMVTYPHGSWYIWSIGSYINFKPTK
ncbi:hypothetical protein DN53_15510 [Flagellimonas olearia]|uniref:Uncharacterized protein n=1 Tax=Flagellimonas olearia TaxID=552546 RepID=A0A444VJV5_9FLAO|nr:hypothetical protein DN53_15510 [Allomuricauda olearia]